MTNIYIVYEYKDAYSYGEYIGTDCNILKAFVDEDKAREMIKGKLKAYCKKVELVEK
jgi:hypothetical protein